MDNFILIRGLARESGHWNDFPTLLKEQFPNAKIHFIDLPGAGKWHTTDFPIGKMRVIDFVHDQIVELKKENKGSWAIIAISLGGMVSLKLLEAYPNDADCAFIINSSARDLSPFYKRLYYKVYKSFLGTLTSTDIRDRERKILNFTTNHLSDNQKEKISKEWADIHQERPMLMTNVARQLLWAAKTKSPTSVQTKLLILAGKGDILCHYSCSENLAKKLNKSIILHDTAGHDLTSDDGPWVIDRVNDFIENDL
jgi:pimeloyl-ACP methyl ester carboxylesterase